MTERGCPYCGQGALLFVRFHRIPLTSYVCDECDIVWLHYEDIGDRFGLTAAYLFSWMGTEGHDPEWDVLRRVEWPWNVEHA